MHVKLLPDLFPQAHRHGEGALLRVWYLARTVSPEHGYRISRPALIAAMIRHLNIKPRYANELIARGTDTWWRIDAKHDLVYLHGARKVGARLNCAVSDALPVQIPLAQLGKLEDFYAANYAAYMQRYVRANNSLPVSRTELRQIFGVVRNTLRRWEKATGIVVTENYAFARPTIFREMPPRHMIYQCQCGQAFNTFTKYTLHRDGKDVYEQPVPKPCKEKDYILVWHRPNSYTPPNGQTVGTASPICSSRMKHYHLRQAHKPSATKCPTQVLGSAIPPAEHTNQLQTPRAIFRYRAAIVSDPIPDFLLWLDVPLTRMARATGCYA